MHSIAEDHHVTVEPVVKRPRLELPAILAKAPPALHRQNATEEFSDNESLGTTLVMGEVSQDDYQVATEEIEEPAGKEVPEVTEENKEMVVEEPAGKEMPEVTEEKLLEKVEEPKDMVVEEPAGKEMPEVTEEKLPEKVEETKDMVVEEPAGKEMPEVTEEKLPEKVEEPKDMVAEEPAGTEMPEVTEEKLPEKPKEMAVEEPAGTEMPEKTPEKVEEPKEMPEEAERGRQEVEEPQVILEHRHEEPSGSAAGKRIFLKDLTPNSKERELQRRKELNKSNSFKWHTKHQSKGVLQPGVKENYEPSEMSEAKHPEWKPSEALKEKALSKDLRLVRPIFMREWMEFTGVSMEQAAKDWLECELRAQIVAARLGQQY